MAAGLGFIEFATGEVLTAAKANGYLASQSVMVFASAAARTSAIASPQEGMISYLKDTNETQFYTGSAWSNVGAGAAQALTLITTTTFSNVASQAFDGIFTSTYKTYFVAINNIIAANALDDLQLQFRYAGPTTQTTSYYGSAFAVDPNAGTAGTASFNASQVTLATQTGGTDKGAGIIYFNHVGDGATVPSFHGRFMDPSGNQVIFGGKVDSSRSYTGFLLKSSSTNITGSVSIYGLAV
jgi:hypothetical protein